MKHKCLHLLILMCAYAALIHMQGLRTALSQDTIPREYVPDSGVVSLSKATPFNIALKALNEFSVRIERKPVIDLIQRTNPINIDIVNLNWRAALELITKKSNLDFIETETYIQIVDAQTAATLPVMEGAQLSAVQAAIPLKPITARLREICISATFFEADRNTLEETGVNWTAILNSGELDVFASQNFVGGLLPTDIGAMEVVYSNSKGGISTVIKALETSDVGEIIANPRITVIDGRKGRVQIGEDFSIKQRDFAGNIIDVFVSAGIILTVTPILVEDDSIQFIYLKVIAERSSASPGALTTIINKTNAQTELLLNDGEEAVIGGLYSTEEFYTRKGIPYLKNIPKWFFGLGYLFGFESKSYSQKELIILLKAEIIPTLEERLAEKRNSGGN